MGTTAIRIRGRDYTVEPFERPNTEKAYRIKGKRGASYETVRNVPRPHLMFLIGGGRLGLMSSVMKGVWLSDKDGELTVVRE